LTRFSIIAAMLLLATPAQAQRLPPDFVYLGDVDPSIVQDMRYAGSDNFTGRALPGYDGVECVLRADAAQALKRVQAALAPSGLSLKVYDCYRPERAVRAMARWSRSPEDGTTRYFYPEADKRALFASGWISPRSAHSSGIAVDLTLVPKSAAGSTGRATAQSRCDGPPAQRRPDTSIDMGTAYDCFSVKSFTRSKEIGTEPHNNRERLRSAMSRYGFKNYIREWWHYTYSGGANPQIFDVPIAPRVR
jgi:D-alanyl-D-alanine dipeptidase